MGKLRFIVITTVQPMSPGMRRFEQLPNSHMIVVGDRRTPAYRSSGRLTFLSLERQGTMSFRLGRELPLDHYSRKNIGYLWAMCCGAESIYDTDDDNLPYDDWDFPDFWCSTWCASTDKFVNVYKYFTDEFVWPRGYPLDEIFDAGRVETGDGEAGRIGVWQGLVDVDPDVDAIFRMLYRRVIRFGPNSPIVLRREQYCPMNSQNTLWAMQAFPYLYLPVTVSFRFTDILRGYVAQRGLWAHGLHLGFTRATVWQERNTHDLMSDFRSEVQCYVRVKDVVSALESLQLGTDGVENLRLMYSALVERELVSADELRFVAAWIEDLSQLRNRK